MECRTAEHVERQPTLTNPEILVSIPITDNFDMDGNCTNVRWCNHYYVIYAKDTRLAAVLVGQTAILHRKYQTRFKCGPIPLTD